MTTIPLSEMLQTLRQELSDSMQIAAGSDLRFAVDAVELQLQVTVAREGSAGGKVKFWVVEAEGGGKLSRADVHTFKLTLKPMRSDGRPVAVADASARKPGA